MVFCFHTSSYSDPFLFDSWLKTKSDHVISKLKPPWWLIIPLRMKSKILSLLYVTQHGLTAGIFQMLSSTAFSLYNFFFPTKKVSFQHLPNSQEELHVRLCAHSSFCLERSSLRHPPGSLSLLPAVLWQNVTLLGSLFQIILPKYDPSCSLWGIVFPYLVLFFFPVFFWSPNIIICLFDYHYPPIGMEVL